MPSVKNMEKSEHREIIGKIFRFQTAAQRWAAEVKPEKGGVKMRLTDKEKAMIDKFMDVSDDGQFCCTCFLCDSRADNAVVGSLCRKGIFKHNCLEGKESGVYLSAEYSHQNG